MVETELSRVVDVLPDLIWTARADGSVEFLNQRWFDYTGMLREDALGTGWTSRVHPADAAPLAAYWHGLLQAGQAGRFEARLRGADGRYRWFLIRAVPLLDSAGGILRWYGQNTDIEDRKQAELLLASEKQLLGLMASGSPLAHILAALGTLVATTVEAAACSVALVDLRTRASEGYIVRFLRAPVGTVSAPAFVLELLDGRSLDVDAAPSACCVLRGEPVLCGDLRNETRWPAWSAAARAAGIAAHWTMPIAAQAGEVVAVIAVLFDQPRLPDAAHVAFMAQLTHLASIAIERTRSENALRQSEAFAAKAQRLSQTGAFSWRVDSGEMVWSDEVHRILEFDATVTPDLALLRSRIHPDDAPAHDALIQRQRAAPADVEHGCRLHFPDGRVKWVHLVAHASYARDGALEYIAALQDITHRRQADEALGKVRSELAHVARVASLGALTASIAHEVNQPLAGIITNASTGLRMLAAEPPNVEGARETVRRTLRDGNRASDVVKRLRALFTKTDVSTGPLDLNDAAREVVAMLLSDLQRTGLVLELDLAPALPPASGDRVQVQQVILNLVLNASDAMVEVIDRPRRLRIATAVEGAERVRLSVSDTGPGVDPQDAERIFQAFYTTKSTGMGIGLSVSRSIIDSHGGTLLAQASDNGGAVFAFTLPQMHAPDRPAEAC